MTRKFEAKFEGASNPFPPLEIEFPRSRLPRSDRSRPNRWNRSCQRTGSKRRTFSPRSSKRRGKERVFGVARSTPQARESDPRQLGQPVTHRVSTHVQTHLETDARMCNPRSSPGLFNRCGRSMTRAKNIPNAREQRLERSGEMYFRPSPRNRDFSRFRAANWKK